jgi:hypothetical protein
LRKEETIPRQSKQMAVLRPLSVGLRVSGQLWVRPWVLDPASARPEAQHLWIETGMAIWTVLEATPPAALEVLAEEAEWSAVVVPAR